jgi:hypothetical protein
MSPPLAVKVWNVIHGGEGTPRFTERVWSCQPMHGVEKADGERMDEGEGATGRCGGELVLAGGKQWRHGGTATLKLLQLRSAAGQFARSIVPFHMHPVSFTSRRPVPSIHSAILTSVGRVCAQYCDYEFVATWNTLRPPLDLHRCSPVGAPCAPDIRPPASTGTQTRFTKRVALRSRRPRHLSSLSAKEYLTVILLFTRH